MDDDELVWKREDADAGYNVYQPEKGAPADSGDMVIPKHYKSKINPGIFEAPNQTNEYQEQTRTGRTVDKQETQQPPQYLNMEPNITSFNTYNQEIESPRQMKRVQSEPQGYGSDLKANYNTSYNQYDQSNSQINTQYSEPDYNYGNFQAQRSNRLRGFNQQSGPYGQGFGSNQAREKNVNPELRDYYQIEESIMRKMMESKETEKQYSGGKNVNVFGGRPKVNLDKSPAPIREITKRNPPPMVEAKLPREVIRKKNLVFRPVEGENPSVAVNQEPVRPANMQEIDSQYIGMSIDELQKILREKNAKLTQLEDQNFHLMNTENNVTFIYKQIQELNRETDKLKEKISHLETEQRLLFEELSSRNENLNELEVELSKSLPNKNQDFQAKKELVDRLDKNQRYIEDMKTKLVLYDTGNNKETEEIKKNSEKNMAMELEEIKINIMNYDEELLKLLKYFQTKVSSPAEDKTVEQNVF